MSIYNCIAWSETPLWGMLTMVQDRKRAVIACLKTLKCVILCFTIIVILSIIVLMIRLSGIKEEPLWSRPIPSGTLGFYSCFQPLQTQTLRTCDCALVSTLKTVIIVIIYIMVVIAINTKTVIAFIQNYYCIFCFKYFDYSNYSNCFDFCYHCLFDRMIGVHRLVDYTS
jgi:hypothetical protein